MQCVQQHTRCEIYPLDSCVIIVHGGHAFPMCNLSVYRDSVSPLVGQMENPSVSPLVGQMENNFTFSSK